MPEPIPVICDRCAARGRIGDELYATFRDLVDFKPVPRKQPRADGWTPEVQRFYVAALALTGSERQAAHAVGKAPYGVTQLKKAKGNEGFLAACAKAMAFFGEEQGRRLSEGLLAAASYAGHRHAPVPAAWSGAATRRRALPAPAGKGAKTPEEEERDRKELLRVLLVKYYRKLKAEREARLRGEIVAADFYLRQLTHIEVAVDVVTQGDGMAILSEARLDGHDLLRIAETNMSRLLDKARHLYWIRQGDPPRPDVPPHHLLQEHDGFATEYGENDPGLRPGHEEKRREITEQMERDAEAQVKWEALARQDYERRRDSDAAS
ncbi:MAG TPA: hypothetical protein VEC11_15155 [Allosphingosinicella sp.]|nr:hypothetical protein [Allosphingosinicella sp.]